MDMVMDMVDDLIGLVFKIIRLGFIGVVVLYNLWADFESRIDFLRKETRWRGQKASVLKGYKLWYVGLDGKRSGVGILVANDILKQAVEVRRCNDGIMLVRIIVGEEVISIISAYGPQVGLDEEVKREFLDNLGDLKDTIPADEKVFIGGDFNGHIGKETINYNSVHGGFVYGVRNESGEILLEFALAKEFIIANSILERRMST
ncbi:uncharacterized protein LOC130805594 [Amaranthus tricolor]|uniref:uncharacterized protein LOC130805594 n=1 Tax=Amaranthus tricolor TaxID=29722 RepID=UPI00258A203F|nr:uncharacterized protein LOC130805594 [Amaranthus tricolor]